MTSDSDKLYFRVLAACILSKLKTRLQGIYASSTSRLLITIKDHPVTLLDKASLMPQFKVILKWDNLLILL